MNKSDSFLRYLSAKKTVDDRAINQTVWQQLLRQLSELSSNFPTDRPTDRPLKILEVGAGIGTMVERLLSEIELPNVVYTAIDINPDAINSAKARLTDLPPGVELHLETVDVFDFINRNHGNRNWDLIISHAFLDLVDISEAVPKLFSLLVPNGLFYFTLNFDGETVLEPLIDRELDAQIESLYHKTMDLRITDGKPSGDSQTGRHLFRCLKEFGGDIICAGSSDWVVFAGREGYVEDEAYFLHYIVNTIQSALENNSELDPLRFKDWVCERHAQIDQNELVYIARQLDFLGTLKPQTQNLQTRKPKTQSPQS